ncbi:hypothetical protein Taro_049112 [Colocasia esculenta]|uniref:Uncharacterized protein n=1 Tax=Colocasia esculenta TaxID=4460 RepID=A0A843X9W4_COLES|nr:hypothetical protein [Colocasia esculenta]
MELTWESSSGTGESSHLVVVLTGSADLIKRDGTGGGLEEVEEEKWGRRTEEARDMGSSWCIPLSLLLPIFLFALLQTPASAVRQASVNSLHSILT